MLAWDLIHLLYEPVRREAHEPTDVEELSGERCMP